MSGLYPPEAWPEPWLARRAALTPGAQALRFAGRALDYGELDGAARRLARALEASGVGAGDVVAVLLPGGLDFVRLFYALRELRAVLLPLNLRLTAVELGFQLRDSGARLLVHRPGRWAPLAQGAARAAPGVVRALLRETRVRVCEDAAGSSGDPPPSPHLPAHPPESGATRGGRAASPAGRIRTSGALAILYTSGTTGRPKGALLGPESFLASASGAAELLGAAPSDRWLVCLPLFHVGGLSILVRCCLAGSSASIHERFDPVAVNDALDRAGITHVSLVATMLAQLLELRGATRAPPSLRCVLLGGGPAPAALIERALELGFPLAPTYGLTEATSQVATRPPGDATPPLDGRLQPLPGSELRIVDESGEPLAAGRAGEICLRGPTLMRGYLSRSDASAGLSRDGWLRTGDVGCLDGEGRLRVLDRRDDLIVSGGENVYPAQVECVLAQHPAVADVAVVGRPDLRFGMRPVAYWVREPGFAGAPELEAFCRERLAAYKVPVAFRCLESLPRSASGKLLRRVLRERR